MLSPKTKVDFVAICPREVRLLRAERYVRRCIGCLLVYMTGCGSDATGDGRDDASSEPGTGSWTALSAAPLASDSNYGAAAWNGKELFVWGGWERSYRYAPDSDEWRTGTGNGGPYSTRMSPSVVWAGDRVILWGGVSCAEGERLDAPCADGSSYDPIKDTWQAINVNGAPSGRMLHTALWTGSRMLIWGGLAGRTIFADGALYDPVQDSWTAMSDSGLGPRAWHSAVWTGTRMIVWGGGSIGTPSIDGTAVGAIYDPSTDSWSRIQADGAPSARYAHSAVWTGTEMIVWGGRCPSGSDPNGNPPYCADGGAYDPILDRWRAISNQGAPSARQTTLVWTGQEVLVWGGSTSTAPAANDGGRYDPKTDTWRRMSTDGAPSPRAAHWAFWTGTRMLVWGGAIGHNFQSAADGAFYVP